MLVSMSDKELKRLSVLQEICDQRITQSQAAQLNKSFNHLARRIDSKSLFWVAQARHAPGLECAYFLFRPE